MSDMLRVTTPVAPREYNPNQGTRPQAPEQVFELGNVDYVNKPNERDEQLGEQNLKDQSGSGLPKLQSEIAKDPALSSVLLKGLVSGNALTALQAAGNAELLNKITEFANEIMLLPNSDKIAEDMVRQQDEATIFSGELWSELKELLSEMSGSPVGEEMSLAVLDFLKAAAAAEARDSILMSISAGLRYLASETAQSRELVDLLNQTADKLNAENFSEVKNDVLALVNYLETSLLLSDKTKSLMSLITYNLSRFSNDSEAVRDSFQAIVNMAPDAETADKLNALFSGFIDRAKLPQDVKLAAMNDDGSPASAAQRSMTMLTERLANAVNEGARSMSHEELLEHLSKIESELSENLSLSKGIEILKETFSPLLTSNMKGGLNTLIRAFENDKDLNALIDRLNVIINRIEDMDSKLALAQSLNLLLADMSHIEGVSYRPPTAMENMLDFLIKNINDPSLRSLAAMNRSEMLQGLLTAPGVFTPLLHFLVPMNMDGLKAFGELWADPDAGKGTDGAESDKQLFLCFDIEDVGYFELEIYTHGKNINASLLCPPGTEKDYSSLKDTIPVIASSCGYTAENLSIKPLKRKRDLTNVFPKINERRSGLNVSV
ncbi:MAG: hypothetical protein J1E40_01580 [Oscillospiraceae bacterium]|nr:hypothetical protein [Oscillospiraceae bacterium]